MVDDRARRSRRLARVRRGVLQHARCWSRGPNVVSGTLVAAGEVIMISEKLMGRLLAASQSPERDYFQVVIEVLTILNCDETEALGFACLRLLHFSTIRFKDGRVIGPTPETRMGSISDIAEVLPIAFASVSTDPVFWRGYFTRKAATKQAYDEAVKLAVKLREHPAIKSVRFEATGDLLPPPPASGMQ